MDALANLIALVDRYQSTTDEWDCEVLLGQMREAESAVPPDLKRLAHFAIEGALYVRRQSDLGKRNGGVNLARNIEMAAACIKLRHDPANDGRSDKALMEIVRKRSIYKLKPSAARSAILDGLAHAANSLLIKQFGVRGHPNKPRSIFDGSKRPPNNDRRIDSDT